MQWSTPQRFSWLRLIFKQGVPDSIDDLKIVFRHSQNTNCQNRKMAVVNDRTIDIHCDTCQFQELVFSGAALVDLCRVHISGGRNVALKQPTSQRSNYSDNVCNEMCSLSGNAVDGNTDSNLYSRSCTHTDIREARPWWRLEFTHPKVVTKVALYNRHRKLVVWCGGGSVVVRLL
ncbi:fucolectin-1-like [Physella acuta]|uniref:fucolectin-1-like n=1 Tax=Physella acuta TaxID=109671 RepID=UPI0027DDC549|nr:fucolectin-1-like [Physella acuta]